MLKLKGVAYLQVPFSITLPTYSEGEWELMSHREKESLLDSHIDWLSECRNAELDNFDIDELEDL